MSADHVKVFTQWRPRRLRAGDKRVIDYSSQTLYVCAYWRVRGHDGKSKQAGCSISADRHGIENAVRKALRKARKAVPSYRATTGDVMATLTW